MQRSPLSQRAPASRLVPLPFVLPVASRVTPTECRAGRASPCLQLRGTPHYLTQATLALGSLAPARISSSHTLLVTSCTVHYKLTVSLGLSSLLCSLLMESPSLPHSPSDSVLSILSLKTPWLFHQEEFLSLCFPCVEGYHGTMILHLYLFVCTSISIIKMWAPEGMEYFSLCLTFNFN